MIFGRIVVATLFTIIGLFVLCITSVVLQGRADAFLSSRWTVDIAGELAMAVYSLILILIFSKGHLATYGFSITGGLQWKPVIAFGLGLGVVVGAIGPLLGLDGGHFLSEYSFLQIVVIIWICSSVAEEILMRGLVQSYLTPLRSYGIQLAGVKISAPVLLAALLFSLIHLSILTTGAEGSFVVYILLFTFFVGLLAGYYREITGSIIPAIVVHIFANIGAYSIDLGVKALH